MTGNAPLQLSDIRPGTQFQHYSLLEQIGVGGQGVVWSALDKTRQQVVAIKLNEIFETDQRQIDDRILERQGERLALLHHPHVLPLFEMGISGRLRYMVTPYVAGGTLVDWLRSGLFTVDLALRCAAEIGSALDYLHKEEIVHRDLKPGNVFVDLVQNSYVADFGLARVVTDSTQVMHTGRGTPPYAAPEQHAMSKMTFESDVYSFGVMLYELFTFQLPWEGERALGLEQLHTNVEIPDPKDVNPRMPAGLVGLLRKMTAVNPEARPVSATESVRQLFQLFGKPDYPPSEYSEADEISLRKVNAQVLLSDGLSSENLTTSPASLSLTKFALIDVEQKRIQQNLASATARKFMLRHALIYGFHDDAWWDQVNDPQERLEVAAGLIKLSNETIATTEQVKLSNEAMTTAVIGHLLKDPGLRSSKDPLSGELKSSLLTLAGKADDPWLREESLDVLLTLVPPAQGWRDVAISQEHDEMLADMALQDNAESKAVQLIGHLRSRAATQKLLQLPEGERRTQVLEVIQQSAGGLPDSTPLDTRARLFAQWIWRRLTARPLASLGSYGLSVAGTTIGFSAIAYLSYRLPDFLDTVRIAVSLERGFFLGIFFSLGIFLTRLLSERFSSAPKGWPLVLSATLGTGLFYLAFLAYDVIVLDTPPSGLLLPGSCLLIAIGYALGSLFKKRFLKIGLAFLTLAAVLAGSWYVILYLGSGATTITPPIAFEATLPVIQVILIISLSMLPVAALGSLIDLTLQK
ncbi:MAG TPA: protein kinase [Anaerolineales bacterium]|nr:protein kinase [Anaerolineales bacterium]